MIDVIRQFGQKTFSSLSIRNYRLYFFGQGISQCGTWMQTVALGWLVLTLSGSGTELGLVLALQFLPLLFAAPWGGGIVDTLNKRHILYWTQSLLGLLSLIVCALIFTHVIEMWMVFLIAFFSGLVKVFDNPARQTFISEIVGDEHVKNAVSLNSTMVNLARAVGPTIGGALIAGVGIAFCFLIDAASYIAVIFMLSRMEGEELERTPQAPKDRPRVTDGFRYVRTVPLISATLILMTIVGTFTYEFATSLPIFAQKSFLGDATVYAALTASFGAGSAIGGLYAASRHRISPRQLVLFTFLFGAAMCATALSPTFHWAVIGLLVVGFFSINVTSIANTTIQLESRADMRGRVMALWNMAIFGTTPIGGPIIGWVGEHIGARYAIALGGVAAIGAAILAGRTLLRRSVLEPVPDAVELQAETAVAQNAKA